MPLEFGYRYIDMALKTSEQPCACQGPLSVFWLSPCWSECYPAVVATAGCFPCGAPRYWCCPPAPTCPCPGPGCTGTHRGSAEAPWWVAHSAGHPGLRWGWGWERRRRKKKTISIKQLRATEVLVRADLLVMWTKLKRLWSSLVYHLLYSVLCPFVFSSTLVYKARASSSTCCHFHHVIKVEENPQNFSDINDSDIPFSHELHYK